MTAVWSLVSGGAIGAALWCLWRLGAWLVDASVPYTRAWRAEQIGWTLTGLILIAFAFYWACYLLGVGAVCAGWP